MRYQLYPQKINSMRKIVFLAICIFYFACSNRNSIHDLVEEVISSEMVFGQLYNIDKDMKFHIIDVHDILNKRATLQIGNNRVKVKRDQNILKKIRSITFLNKNKNLLLLSKKYLTKDEFEIFIYHPNSGMIVTNKIKVNRGKSYKITSQELGDI